MGALTKTLYDTDFVVWADRTAELLRQGKFDEVDLEHLIEEVENLAKSDRRAVRSQLGRLIMHLVKLRIQPERETSGWRSSIVDARRQINALIEDSPSLLHHLEQTLERNYAGAVKDALDETGLASRRGKIKIPEACPFTLSQLLESELDTLAAMLA
jgi:Domain of unknown function DUF29